MDIKHYKVLHYLLIILLMLAPMRSVMALQLAPCDMADMDMEASSVSMPASMSVSMQGHDMHHMSSHDMSSDQTLSDKPGAVHKCCCCDNGCTSNCDMGMTAPLLIQASSYSPVFVKASSLAGFISATLVRALTPPSRPPADPVI